MVGVVVVCSGVGLKVQFRKQLFVEQRISGSIAV